MEAGFQLPNGHILNLQPRQRNGKRTRPGEIGRVCREHATKPVERSELPASNETRAAPTTTPRKTKPTKLPVLKAFTDKDHSRSKEKTPPMGQKERGLDLRIQPKSSLGASERESPKATHQEREQYWRKVRDKREKDSPQSRNKDYYHEAYRKIISLASSPRQEIAKHMLKHSGGIQSTGDANCGPDTRSPGVGTPYMSEESSLNLHKTRPVRQKKGQLIAGHKLSSSSNQSGVRNSPGKTETTTDSSDNSRPSISPVSGPSTSITEWEDRFVVNMPSARDPNPPTMDAQQIAEFQKSIEKVHKEGGAMLDPETLPSPRTTTPEENFARCVSNDKSLGKYDGQDLRPNSLSGEDESGSTGPPGQHRYYCPDEIGKPRFSTIWEESSIGPKRRPPQTNSDGSFLGCKVINGAGDRNPDEILLFSTMEECSPIVDVSSSTPKMPRESNLEVMRQMATALEEKTVVQEEWKPISQNLKHAQCSKLQPRTMCHEAKCQRSETIPTPLKVLGKENLEHKSKPSRYPEKHKQNAREDDVFIITPTITRTMVSMADIRGYAQRHSDAPEPTSRSAGEIITDPRTRSINTKPQTSATPSGLRRATQNSWEKSNVPSSVGPMPAPTIKIPVLKHHAEAELSIEKPRALRGYIRTSGIVRSSTENLTGRITASHQQASFPSLTPRSVNATEHRSVSDTPRLPKSCSTPQIAQTTSINNRDTPKPTAASQITEVAELDGLQVDETREISPGIKPTPLNADFRNTESQTDIKGMMNLETLNLIMNMLLLSVSQAQALYRQIIAKRNSKGALFKLLVNGILRMLEHCLQVSRDILAVVSVYTATGAWPRTSEKELARSLAEFGQAMVYLVILGFIMIIIGRAAGYVVFIGSWIVWFAKPFALVFGTVGRVLLV